MYCAITSSAGPSARPPPASRPRPPGPPEQAALARDRAERAAIDGYWDALSLEQQTELDDAALAGASSDTFQLAKGPLRKIGVQILRRDFIRQRLQAEGKLPTLTE